MKWFFYCLFVFFLLSFDRSFSQVNPQNGAAQANIPLYSYSDPGNRLGLNAALVYVDGNGLKVSEMASEVGTGWSLDCGGAITRIQHGEPDDQKYIPNYDYSDQNNYTNHYGDYQANYYPDGYLYTTYLPSDVIDNGSACAPYTQYVPFATLIHTGPDITYKMLPTYLADREQDVFSFTFNGHTGEFVIGKNKQIRILNDSKLKVDLVETDMSASGIRTRISQFAITDESGIKYVFRDLKTDYVCTYNDVRITGNVANSTNSYPVNPNSFYSPPTYGSNPSNGDNLIDVILGRPTSQFVVNKWYLSQIINPLTNKQINFNYTTYNEDINTDKLIQYSPVNNHGTVSVVWEKYKTIDKRLSSVILSNAERIDFTYSASPRIDLLNQNALNQLTVNYNNAMVYSWKFGYGYMVGIDNAIKGPDESYSDDEKQWARLCLTTLQKIGSNNASEPPYQFAYNMGGDNGINRADVIPPMFSIYQDHFGYYNGGEIFSPIPEGSMTAFYSVEKLKNILGAGVGGPSNGFYKRPLSTIAKNGILKSITYPLGGTLSFTYEMNNTPQLQLGGVRVDTTTQYDGISHTNDIIKQYNYVNADGSSSGWGGEAYTYITPITLVALNCQAGLIPAFSAKEFALNFLEERAGSFVVSLASGATVGGALTSGVGSSLEGAMHNGLEFIAIYTVMSIIESLTPSGSTNEVFNAMEYHNYSTVAGNPLPWGYARTEVVNLLSSDNIGKTVYEFSNPNSPGDRPIDLLVPNVLYSSRPRFAPWAYGLPKIITVSDKSGKTVKQTFNHYNFIVNILTDNNFLSKSYTDTLRAYICKLIFDASGQTGYVKQETYYPFTGHTELTSTDEYTFNAQQQSTVLTTNYEYDANFQLKHKYFNNSKGEKVETFYYHPYDYSTAPGAIGTMNSVNSNIFNPVLSTETYINKNGNNQYLIGAVNTDFDVFSNGDIKPKVSYSFQNALPLANSALQSFSPSEVLRDPSYFKQIALYDYDNHGNLVQTITGGNKIASNIYDYDGKLVVASVSNASYSDIGYTSFEAEGGKPGSWVNTAAIVTDDARTGNKSFNLSDPSNPANNYFGFGGLNSSLTYIVSYWSRNGTPCVSGSKGGQTTVNTCQGTVGWKQGTTVNGWTYYEVQVSNFDKISLSGTGLVDEFRVYPVGSQMTTTTYTPLIGKTSECDVSNRVTYYTYDDLGRLIKVSDDQRNVIRTYEYNYKQ